MYKILLEKYINHLQYKSILSGTSIKYLSYKASKASIQNCSDGSSILKTRHFKPSLILSIFTNDSNSYSKGFPSLIVVTL